MAMQGKMLQTKQTYGYNFTYMIFHDTCIVCLWFIPILFSATDLPFFDLAAEAMSGLKTSEKDADGDDDFASANSDNPEEDDELYQFLDAVSLFSWAPSQV